MEEFTPEQWAAWVLTGDPCNRIPGPLETLALRIARAIRWSNQPPPQIPLNIAERNRVLGTAPRDEIS